MTTAPLPICESCDLLSPGPVGFGMICQAFPEGIPDRIYIDGFDHRRRYPGDKGVRFVLSTEPGSVERLRAYERSRR